MCIYAIHIGALCPVEHNYILELKHCLNYAFRHTVRSMSTLTKENVCVYSLNSYNEFTISGSEFRLIKVIVNK